MKKLFVLVFLTASFIANSQTTDATLNKRLAEYLAYSKDLKIDLLLEYMYPRIFEMASKEQIKEVLESAYNNPDIEIKLDSMGIGSVLGVSTFSKGAFTKFSYSVKMKITLLNKEMEDKSAQVLKNFKNKFGDENVSYDNVSKIFWVYQNKEALAIKDNYSKNIWTMLGLEEDQSIFSIIPAEIKTKYHLQ